ncbi:MAG TPA: DUF5709 domain-containing protein [Acidimicrobiales bacterium]|jgi:hypothetical protein|nr:DUF5709 domain-containing protein [Acidimicrobiales bacterium]
MPGNRPYDNSQHLDAEGVPDLETPINQDEGLVPPGDQPIAADEFGVTAREERAEEPLADRITREVPDLTPDDIDLRDADRTYDELESGTGRIIEPGSEDVGLIDDEKDVIGSLVGEDEGALTAEEAAIHVTDTP